MTPGLKLILVGFGAVARGFVELLLSQDARLKHRYGLTWTIVGIATADHGSAINGDGIDPRRAIAAFDHGSLTELHSPHEGRPATDTVSLVERAATLSHAPEPTAQVVVVENTPLGLNGGQPGVDHVRVALTQGAHVITANKGPAAFAHRELMAVAGKAGRRFLYEGAVLDGLPVFGLLRSTLPAVRISGVRGIVNTTTNHILSAMEEGWSLDEALKDMQAAGVTEVDPSNDIDGWDAAAKTAVLANSLLGADMTPHEVARTGLRSLTTEQVASARKQGRRIKLVASARVDVGGVVATVGPVELDDKDPLFGCNGTAKMLELETDLLGRIQISKSESGVQHTAYALLADLIEVSRDDGSREPTDDARQETDSS